MLHFPSANSAAHHPSPRDVAKLSELLNDDVWAFSNCRVDAPGRPVAEVDWFFYNARHGTLMVSEWKGFPQRVVAAADTGARWQLEGGLMVANPVEQVSRQLDAVRAALRISILPEHFPAFDPAQLRLMQSVYSPQVDSQTVIERIRWGRVYGSLPDLAAVISTATSPTPLVLPGGGTQFGLAAALCALFRTSLPADVKARLQEARPRADTSVVQRISAIHRQIAALHEELADLMVTFVPVNDQGTQRSAASATDTQTTVQTAKKAPRQASVLTDQQRMSVHLARSFHGVNGSADAAAKAVKTAWAAVLADPLLHGEAGISVSLFGSVGTPLVKQHHGSLPKLLGMPLRKWCLIQAQAAGLKPLDVPGQPSNIRVR